MSKVRITNLRESKRDSIKLFFTAPDSNKLGFESVPLETEPGGEDMNPPDVDRALIEHVISLGGIDLISSETLGSPELADFMPENRADRNENEPVTKSVREQYEVMPYPMRDPEDDKKFLLLTMLDNLMLVNQTCFQGRKNFCNGFKVLVAGGGTGDAMLYLCAQLAKVPNAKITYIDLSAESMRIAKERLHNQAVRLSCPEMEEIVDFRIASLLDVASLGFGPFDYINCSGVLHHLQDPAAGVRALRAILKEDGAMGIMLYGKIGRTSIYPMQELMRLVNYNTYDIEEKIRNTNLVLENLPLSNPHKRNGRWLANASDPVEIFDIFLHSRDCAFSVDELYELFESNGLYINGFNSDIASYIDSQIVSGNLPSRIRKQIEGLSPRELVGFLELHLGHFNKFEFYVGPNEEASIDLSDENIVPAYTILANIREIPERILNCNPGEPVLYKIDTHFGESIYTSVPDELLRTVCRNIDGRRSMKDIVEIVRGMLANLPNELVHGIILQRLDKLIQSNMISFRRSDCVFDSFNEYDF